ncbi:MAG: sulfur carrier protein ThiS [Deltaproteobacteria bacterium]|nr:sulfur carrier protein ThiS [Deltaproteobacteria bacterium]
MITVNDSQTVEWTAGLTVAGLLKALGWDYALIAVTIDGQFVAPEDFDSRPVPDGSAVQAIHIAHGG